MSSDELSPNNLSAPLFQRTPEYDADLAKVEADCDRVHELDHAIEWALMLNPKAGDHIHGQMYAWRTDKIRSVNNPILQDSAPIRFVYQYDESKRTIYMLGISIAQDDPPDDKPNWEGVPF